MRSGMDLPLIYPDRPECCEFAFFIPIDTVITGKTGSNAHKLLQAAKITIHIWPREGTVRQALMTVFPDIQNLNEPIQDQKNNTAQG